MRKSTRKATSRIDSDDDDFKPPAVPGRGSRMMPMHANETRSNRQQFPDYVPDSSASASASAHARARARAPAMNASYDSHNVDGKKKAGKISGRGSATSTARQHFPEHVPDTSARARAPAKDTSYYSHDVGAKKEASKISGRGTTSIFHQGQAAMPPNQGSYENAAFAGEPHHPGRGAQHFDSTASPSVAPSTKYQYVEEEKSPEIAPYMYESPPSSVHPGAIAVDGPGIGGPSQYVSTWDMNPTRVRDQPQPPQANTPHQQEQDLAVAAEVVPEESDVEAQVDERVRQQTDKIAARVRESLIQEAVHADVVVEDERDTDSPEDDNRSACTRKKKWWITGGIAVVLIGFITGLVVLLVPKKSDGDNDKPTFVPTTSPVDPTTSPSEPSDGPTQSPSTATAGPPSRLDSLRERLVPAVGNVFTDPSSPQYAALEWLANDDPANLPISSTPLPTLKNRFIFATLYFSTNGTSWTNQYNFLSASDICEWNDGGGTQANGIVCNEDLGFEITLEENGLAGPFPEEITYLDELAKLDVDDNLITGTIPESIGRLSLLETVDLKGNSMHGTLPSPLFDLPKLESVNMFMNEDISGTIPQNVGNAVSLRELIIGSNSITGTIPSSVSNLRSLETFVIAFNQISGSIPDLDNSPQLSTIFLDSNIKLSGSIPSSIGNLPRLRRFTASKNALTGKIPSFAGNSGTLEELWLYENLLTGISDFFETAAGNSLKVVQCHHNQFQDSLPSRIGQFSNLRILDISDNQMVGSIPTEVGLLPIQAYKGLSDDPGSFDIGNNRMTGTIPSQLGRFSMADRIDVGRNQLTGPIPSELGQCIQMSTLHVGFNQLEGTVPTELAALPLLDRLYVMGNDGITGDLDTFFCSRPTPFTDIWSDCLRDDVTCSCCGHCCASSDSFSCKDAPF